MQIIEETAAQYGLAALLQEKPFNNINGSGKHNNWSIGTHDGVNLLNIGQITKAAGDDAFPTIMAAIVSAIDKHGDLMRMAISSPGNDFRLGACEAPPAIVSTYLGDDMTEYLTAYAKGGGKYEPKTKDLSMGVEGMRHMEIPAQDRNRTSPFPYGGHRFEFRAVGSAQNVSLVNTVLNTITANAFKEVADRIEGGETAQAVAADLINTHVPKVTRRRLLDELLGQRPWSLASGEQGECGFGWRGARDSLLNSHRSSSTATTTTRPTRRCSRSAASGASTRASTPSAATATPRTLPSSKRWAC